MAEAAESHWSYVMRVGCDLRPLANSGAVSNFIHSELGMPRDSSTISYSKLEKVALHRRNFLSRS